MSDVRELTATEREFLDAVAHALTVAARTSAWGPIDGPYLGLATTRELLEELKARGETEDRYREEGDAVAIGAANLLDTLPGSMLEYRTVEP